MKARGTSIFIPLLLSLSSSALAADPWATVHRFSNHYYEPGRKVIVPAQCPPASAAPHGAPLAAKGSETPDAFKECLSEAEVVGLRPETAGVEVRFRSGALKGTHTAVPLFQVAIPDGCTLSREFYYCVGMEVSGPGGVQGKVIGIHPNKNVAIRLPDGTGRTLNASVLTRKAPCTNVERCFAEMEARLWKNGDQTHVKVVDPYNPPRCVDQDYKSNSLTINDSRNRRRSASDVTQPPGLQDERPATGAARAF